MPSVDFLVLDGICSCRGLFPEDNRVVIGPGFEPLPETMSKTTGCRSAGCFRAVDGAHTGTRSQCPTRTAALAIHPNLISNAELLLAAWTSNCSLDGKEESA